MRHGTIKASKESFLDSCLVFEFNVITYNVLSPNHLDCQHGWHGFNRIQNQLMCFNAVGGLKTFETGFWPYISKLRLLRRQNFLRIFSPCVRWVLPAAWPRAAAPEAKHRCMWQPRTATTRSSNRSSRPRQRWMWRRTNGAAASGEDLEWKNSWGNGIFAWGSGWNVDSIQGFSWFVFSLFMESVSQNMCTTILFCSLVVTIFHDCVLCPPWVVFLWSDFRVGLCSWVWGVHHSNMWRLPFCTSDNLNASFSISIASSAIFGLDTWNKKTHFL